MYTGGAVDLNDSQIKKGRSRQTLLLTYLAQNHSLSPEVDPLRLLLCPANPTHSWPPGSFEKNRAAEIRSGGT
eukprot:2681347-Karenia_brevis.AAC.1